MTAATSPSPPTPPVSPARFLALLTYVFRACLPPRRLAILALPCLAIAGSGLLALAVDEASATDAFARVVGDVSFGLAIPLGTLVIGDAVLGAEVRSGTFAFTWLTPARFGEIAAARWLGGWVVSLFSLVPAVALAGLLAGAPGEIGPMAVATAAGSAAHIALFVMVGAITRRAAVWSLGIVFLVERLLGAVLSGIAQLSPTWQARATYVGLGDAPSDMSRSGIPEGWDAVIRLGVLTTVFVVGASLALRRLRLSGARD